MLETPDTTPAHPDEPTDTGRTFTRRELFKRAGAVGALGVAGSYSVFVEPRAIQTNVYRIPVPNLPEPFAGFRVVHLSDIHHGPLVPLSLVRTVVDRANALQADAIFCTGDYVHKRYASDRIDAVWTVLRELHAPRGVFSILGNHDHWADTDRSLWWLHQTGQALYHKAVSLEKGGSRIWLAGTGDLQEDYRPLDPLLADIPEPECRIVLAHNPETADTPFFSRVDLMVSGHTHGGQVRLPLIGPPILPVRNRTYSCGLKTSPRGANVFISRGIGWAHLPIRLNCPPEIAVLELAPAANQT